MAVGIHAGSGSEGVERCSSHPCADTSLLLPSNAARTATSVASGTTLTCQPGTVRIVLCVANVAGPWRCTRRQGMKEAEAEKEDKENASDGLTEGKCNKDDSCSSNMTRARKAKEKANVIERILLLLDFDLRGRDSKDGEGVSKEKSRMVPVHREQTRCFKSLQRKSANPSCDYVRPNVSNARRVRVASLAMNVPSFIQTSLTKPTNSRNKLRNLTEQFLQWYEVFRNWDLYLRILNHWRNLQ